MLADRITVLRDGKKGRHRRRSEIRPRAHCPGDGRARPVAVVSTACVRRPCARAGERVLTVQNLKMAPDGEEQLASFVFAGQITGVFGLLVGMLGGPRPSSDRRQGVPETRLLPRRRSYPAREAGALSRASDRGSCRHRLCPPKTARSKASSRPGLDRPQHLSLGLLAKFPAGRTFLLETRGQHAGSDWIARLNVRKLIGDQAKVVELSGGNQQKVVDLSKSLRPGAEFDHFRRA